MSHRSTVIRTEEPKASISSCAALLDRRMERGRHEVTPEGSRHRSRVHTRDIPVQADRPGNHRVRSFPIKRMRAVSVLSGIERIGETREVRNRERAHIGRDRDWTLDVYASTDLPARSADS